MSLDNQDRKKKLHNVKKAALNTKTW